MKVLRICINCIGPISPVLLLLGCSPAAKPAASTEPKVSGDTLTIPANSPQCAALTVEPVGTEQPALVPLTGRLVWNEDETVRVFTPFAGIVRNLPVALNQPVTKGAPLAEIQSADFGQAQADARKAESEFRRADRNLNRLRDLFEHGAAPRKDVESAEADFAGAQAEKDRSERRLAIYGSSSTSTNQDFLLPSPLDGILVERNVTPGQEVRPDQMLANVPQFTAPLFTVTDPTKLWVWLDVTEMHLPLVHQGQELLIHSKAFPNQVFKGQLELIGDSLDPTTRTVRARGTVENASKLLKAELYVTVEIPDAVPMSLQVPSKAVFLRENEYYVFLEMAAGQFQRQPVKLGSERNGKVAILEGLKTGQRLVTEGCLLLQSLMENAPKS
ncbi:MAG TPA: efflux RND transporter periplasmic adaptor subunit [Candidatus Binatia bacterium]|jgi:cobalt-zinc-cadmium efflux system membrane fusion protein|nr:efflux RND transporter periplasmic adaptor subunit [Candidatus Binatia bacterium]